MKLTYIVYISDINEWEPREVVNIFGIPMLMGDHFGPVDPYRAVMLADRLTRRFDEYSVVELAKIRAQHPHSFGKWLRLLKDEFIKRTNMERQSAHEWVMYGAENWFEYYVDGYSPYDTVTEETSYWND